MNIENYISISNLCMHYQVSHSFVEQIEQSELIEIKTINDVQYLNHEFLDEVEKMIRIHQDLEVDEENIDIVYNLIKKVEKLQLELCESKKQLQVFQSDVLLNTI